MKSLISRWYIIPVRFLEGVAVGLGGILPGISGGTLCAAFGIHKIMSECISRPMLKIKQYFRDLLFFILGGAIGFIGLAKASASLYELFPSQFTCVFAGMLLGTLPALWKDAGTEGRGKKGTVSLCISFCAIAVLLFVMVAAPRVEMSPNGFGFMLCGVLWGLSILLPGLSASTAILYCGLYQPMLEGIAELKLSVILPLGAGALFCLVFAGKVIALGYRKQHEVLSHCVLGAVAATTVMLIFSVERLHFGFLVLGLLLSYPLTFTKKKACASRLPKQ